MILACCLIGFAAYLSIETANYFRIEFYRTRLSAGPMTLISDMVARQPPDQRVAYLERIARSMDTELGLRSAETLKLRPEEKKKLDRGGMVLRGGDGRKKAIVLTQIPGVPDQYLYGVGEHITESQARGLALLMVDYLSSEAPSQWDAMLKAVNARFGFPVKRVAPHLLELEPDKRDQLFNKHEPIVLFSQRRGSGTYVTSMVLLPKTGEVLVLGPQDMFNWYPLEMLVVIVLFCLLAVGLAAYGLVKPLELRLSTLEKTVLRMRGGDLSARVETDGRRDAIGQLAVTLNGMAEHIQRLLSAQKELTRAVSHELRTPVARIRFGLEMMVDEENVERREKHFEDIDRDIDQLDKLIDEILTYSKLEEGTPVLNFTMIDLDALLRRIEQESRALGKPIAVDYVAPDLSAEKRFAEGEERYIHRIVQNFVGNAMRYANSHVRITYEVIGDLFRIDVDDDGPGIPPEDRQRVFQPFTRLDDSRTRTSGGYGLGLSIVARIAFWHGGKAKVGESDMGGARFSFYWPRLQSLRESS
ncbi:Signal transduction histidine kinase sensor [gamma proteobacterium HdN1]|nr:Signal transduction histidine kinase sensor [gamma proteobacterium HdN1]